jgi:hypothetical protein
VQYLRQVRTLHKKPVRHNVLQEFLQALADSVDKELSAGQQKLMLSYAELQYHLYGRGRCSICHASVRHELPVTVEHTDGTIDEYICLCTRCLERERVSSNRVTLTIGRARLEYTTSDGRPEPGIFRAYAT